MLWLLTLISRLFKFFDSIALLEVLEIILKNDNFDNVQLNDAIPLLKMAHSIVVDNDQLPQLELNEMNAKFASIGRAITQWYRSLF